MHFHLHPFMMESMDQNNWNAALSQHLFSLAGKYYPGHMSIVCKHVISLHQSQQSQVNCHSSGSNVSVIHIHCSHKMCESKYNLCHDSETNFWFFSVFDKLQVWVWSLVKLRFQWLIHLKTIISLWTKRPKNKLPKLASLIQVSLKWCPKE